MAKGSNKEARSSAAQPTENPNMSTEQAQPAQAAEGTQAAAAAPAANKQGAAIVLEGGEKRVDYIKRRWAEGASRSAIAKELNVPYQIVFASTKVPKPADPNAPAKAPSGRVPVTIHTQAAKAAAAAQQAALAQVDADAGQGQQVAEGQPASA